MRNTLIVLFLCFGLHLNAQQKQPVLSGFVKDANNGELITGATVFVDQIKSGTLTNAYGFYSISMSKGKYLVKVSCMGYKTIEKEFDIQGSLSQDFSLEPDAELISEIDIFADRKDRNTKSNEMSLNKLQMKTIQKIPALMGEVDVLRTIQFLPGVHSGGEGSIGYFVRGGGVDQNLILLDEATVYNASHMGGLFSVFNQDAIKDVTLYKGGIPAVYGGRLSSILDIRMKEGNQKKLNLTGGIGLVSSRITLEAPIVKEKASFIISGRRTYFDLFFPILGDSVLKESKAFFYDLNLKANYQINENNRVFISGYFGRDVVQFGKSIRVNYGNQTFTARYNHIFSKKVFANLNFIYSVFDYGMGVPEGSEGFDWKSGINDLSIKNDYTWFANTSNTIKFGFQTTHHTFRPGKAIPIGDQSIFTGIELPHSYALESGFFIENDQELTKKMSVRYGLRFSTFSNLGPYTSYVFDKTEPKNYVVADTIEYQKNKLFNTQFGIEPRFSFKYELNMESSIKLSYNHMIQYLHLTTNTMSTTPLDLWFPSSPNVKPQVADQLSIGYFRNFLSDAFETSLEVYYKKMYNSIDFNDHAQLLLNKKMEGELRFGDSYAYGAELLIRKQRGKFTGWLSYTFSRVFREIPEINSGLKYPAHYDKPNNLTLILSYDITNDLNVSINWLYSTGAPRTMPTGRFEYSGMVVPVYSDRNSVRLPDYHRMDAAVTYNFNKFKKNGKERKVKSSLNLSVYNLYNRHNAYSISFNQSEDDPNKTEAIMMYLFKVFPAITYNFTLN